MQNYLVNKKMKRFILMFETAPLGLASEN